VKRLPVMRLGSCMVAMGKGEKKKQNTPRRDGGG
jgi:hypothetical protein